MHSDSKRQLRRHLRAQRQSLDRHQQNLAARRLLNQLRRLPEYRNARHIAGYWASDGEISLQSLFRHARFSGKRYYLPIIARQEGKMTFHRYCQGQWLFDNRYGMKEPGRRQPSRPIQKFDVIIVPLVGFDRRGRRLGMGGGYYDRALTFKCQHRPFLIGVAHALQEVQCLPTDHWDVPMDAIVTDQTVIRLR